MLTPSSLACLARIPTINLTAGCAHRCIYCYTQGYSCNPGPGRIVIYGNTLKKLQEELGRRRKKPQAVYFSPASDLFQPVPAVLELAYDVLACLLERKIGVAFLTKGQIPQRHMELLRSNVPLVRAQVGLITLDKDIASMFEPNAPSPAVRLRQIRSLVQHKIRTQVRLDPILPGLTDSNQSFEALVAPLGRAGVSTIAASTLFVRPAVTSALKRALPPGMYRGLIHRFKPDGRLAIHAENSTVTALPREARDDIYRRLVSIASRYGIETKVCACKNPDVNSQSCSITGDWGHDPSGPVQPSLFADMKRSQHGPADRDR